MKKTFVSLLIVMCVFFGCKELSIGLSSSEIAEGLKEALHVGVKSSVTSASATDGYLKNEVIKLLLPKEVKALQETIATGKVTALGGAVNIPYSTLLTLYIASNPKIDKNPFDELVVAMNKGAESAANDALPIFTNALTSMSIRDALGILQGTDTSATHYFKNATSKDLISTFEPKITSALANTNAIVIYEQIAGFANFQHEVNYGLGTFPIKVSDYINVAIPSDIEGYATEKAVDGLFTLVGEEEKKIRSNPLNYTSAIIQKVFNSDEAKTKK